MKDGIGIAVVTNWALGLRRKLGAALGDVDWIRAAFRPTGMLVPALAQTIRPDSRATGGLRTASRRNARFVLLLLMLAGGWGTAAAQNQLTIAAAGATSSFPITAIGHSSSQTFTLTASGADAVDLWSVKVAPGYSAASEYQITSSTCSSYLILNPGNSCAVTVSFTPQLPGSANSPVPIIRSAPLLAVYQYNIGGSWVNQVVNFPLTGSGTGPVPVVTPGLISDMVGNDATAASGYAGDGLVASAAVFKSPSAIAIDGLGNIYIADTGNNVVRAVFKAGSLPNVPSPVVGHIYTVAGIALTGSASTAAAGTDGVAATSSALNGPSGLALDAAGNLYIADSGNNAVRMVSATTGIINTVAGTLNNALTPGCCFTGDQGAATAAQLDNPAGIALDGNGNLYIADSGNNAVRVVYMGGTPLASLIAVEYPLSAVPATVGDIYTVAGGLGNAPAIGVGDGGLASAASLNVPLAVTVDSAGDIYIADSQDQSVRRVDATTGNIATLYQATTSVLGLSVDASDDIYFTLQASCTVLQYNPTTQLNMAPPVMLPVAGNGNCAASGDAGAATLAGLNGALGLVVDGSGNLYLLETDGVRFVDGTQTSFAFGAVNVGNTSATQSIIVTDEDIVVPGNPALSGLQGFGAGYFYVTSPFAVIPYVNLINASTSEPWLNTYDCSNNQVNFALSPGQSCGTSFVFQPVADSTGTPFSGTEISYSGSNHVSLAGTGQGPLPTATLSGGPLAFTGVEGQGYGTAQTLTLTAGSANLAISQISISAGFFNFKESDNCGPLPKLLPGGTSCTISITFAASATGPNPVPGSVTVTDDASTGGGSQSASLSGTGTAPVVLLSSPNINFGTGTPGTTVSAASPLTITNTGNAALTFCNTTIVSPSTIPTCFNYGSVPMGPFTLTGNEADMFSITRTTCGATLAIGASCTVSVGFTPSMPGFYSATLSINDNSGGTGLRDYYASQNVTLGGHGYTPTGTASFTVGNTTFSATAVGLSTMQAVTVQLNNALALQSISIPSGYTEYSAGAISGCTVDGTTVNPVGTICSVQVTFTPTAPGNGSVPANARTAPLIVTTTENGGTPYAFGLSGTGTGSVAALTPGIISNYVGGSGGVCAGVIGDDGIPAANANVGFLNGMALDSVGNMYLSDSMNFVLWKVDPQGILHLYAGNPFQCGGYDQYLNGNGTPALGANIEDGGPLAVDTVGGLYIGNNAANSSPSIRYINPVTKVITSVLGNLSNVYNSATNSNQGNSWESNTYFYPGSIIQETVTVPNPGGIGSSNVNFLFTVTQGGTSRGTAPAFTYILGGTVSDGSVIWTNSGQGTTTGVGCPAQTDAFGDGCTGTNATLYGVSGIALDQGGNLYFADRYKLVQTSPGNYSAVYNAVVRRMDAKTGIVTIYAGTGTAGHSGDSGLATAAKIAPGDLAFDSNGNLYIDEGLYVRMVSPAGIITTVAGSGVASRYQQDVCYGDLGDGGTALSAGFGGVTGIALDAANNLYLTDNTACNLRRVDEGTQKITTIAGNSSAYGYDTGDINNPYGANWDGSAYDASIAQPLLSRVDGMGNIYVMQMSRGVRKINVSRSVMNYGSAQIDTASPPMTTTVVNAGNQGSVDFISPFTAAPAWGISSTNWTRDVTNPNGFMDCYDVGAVFVGYECPINVDFTPLVAGTLTGVNTVTDSAANNPQTITLLGTASGTPPNVTLLPFLLDFTTPQNGTSAPQTLTLTNHGGSAVTIQSFTLAGAAPSAFSQTNNCLSPLAAGASCTLLVTFHPPLVGGASVDAPPPDILTAQVVVTDSDASSPQIANLIGIGTLPAAPSVLSISITEAVHVDDAETLQPTLVLNILEQVHASDGPPAVVVPILLNVPEVIHMSDALTSVIPSTPLNVPEVMHVTDALTSLTPSTLLPVGETIHLSDAFAAGPLKTIPVISWTAPSAITYGAALTALQLDATSATKGTFAYTPALGTVLGAGTQTLSVTFTPNDTTDYTTVTTSVSLAVNQAASTVTWTAPSAITYGAALTALQLDATSATKGTFAYTPALGTVLGAGTQTLSVTFTPTDATDYITATATVSLAVNQAAPTVTWTAPSAITYGAALTAMQLDATSATKGTFTYTPAAGTVLGAGPQTLSVSFTPTDAVDYTTQTATVQLTVNRATPSITWATPTAITYGTALSASQLNATSATAGTLTYTPAAGAVLNAGPQTLSVTFTPTAAGDYTTASATVQLTVNKAVPSITWTAPAAITYGTALSATQLNASSATPGNFTYTPALGNLPSPGKQTLSVTFTPTDTADYTAQTATVQLTVNKATPTVTATPSATSINTPQGLTVTVAVSGATGTVTPTGSVTLTSGNYTSAVATLSSGSATITIPAGSLATGADTLTVSYTPDSASSASYNSATGSSSVTVNAVSAATPTFSVPAGTYTAAQSVTISDTTPNAVVYYTTDGTAPTTSSTKYSTAITVSTSQTLQAIATATDYTASAVATATYTIANPQPAISTMFPALASAGGAAFTLTVNGSSFTSTSTVYWGAASLVTTYVSATQLTAAVTAADIASAGATAITVQTPAPGGGTSNSLQFEVDSTGSGSTPPTFTTITATVAPGATASYPVTLPSSVESATVTCLNLPAGATCSYSSSANAVTITTSATTPKGTYQITVVFTETVSGAASAGFLLPILLLPLLLLRRKMAARGIWTAACMGILLMAATALTIGCGGGQHNPPVPVPSTHQVSSSGALTLTVQ